MLSRPNGIYTNTLIDGTMFDFLSLKSDGDYRFRIESLLSEGINHGTNI